MMENVESTQKGGIYRGQGYSFTEDFEISSFDLILILWKIMIILHIVNDLLGFFLIKCFDSDIKQLKQMKWNI